MSHIISICDTRLLEWLLIVSSFFISCSGTANTISFQCADHPMNTYSLLADGMKFGDNSTSNLSRLWATAQATANQCADYNNATNIGDKISTPTLARDMMSVVDALQQDGLLRYWGMDCIFKFSSSCIVKLKQFSQASPTEPPLVLHCWLCSLIKWKNSFLMECKTHMSIITILREFICIQKTVNNRP